MAADEDDDFLDMPIVWCRESRDGTEWVFQCPYCRRKHIHGAKAGHRTAHCGDPLPNYRNRRGHVPSPYRKTGYFIVVAKNPVDPYGKPGRPL